MTRRQAAKNSAWSAPGPSAPPSPSSGASRRPEPLALRGLADECLQRGVQLGHHVPRRVGLKDAGLGLDDLPQGPERDAVPVGQAATLTPRHELGAVVDEAPELVDQPALADPGLTEQGDQPHRTFPHGVGVAPLEQVQLAVTADERGGRPLIHVHAEPAARPDQPPHRHGLGLALDPDRCQLLVLKQRRGSPARCPRRPGCRSPAPPPAGERRY